MHARTLLLAPALGVALAVPTALAAPVAPRIQAADRAPAPPRHPWFEEGALDLEAGVAFGGTFWNADSSRWQALEDSVWTFDTGVGTRLVPTDACKDPSFHASMEGWVGYDLTKPIRGEFRRLGESAFTGPNVCVGSSGGLSGDYSLWAGLLPSEALALCYVGGQGYGDNWRETMSREFAYDGTDSLLLSYEYSVDAEADYDYAYVFVDTTCSSDGSGEVKIATYTGSVSGTANLYLTQGHGLPSAPGCIRIEFVAFSDGVYSDEDGFVPTLCGLLAVDDIRVRNTEFGGAVDHFADFETGDDGWTNTTPACGEGGDGSRLVALADLPPLPDGLCDFRDSVLAFFDPVTGGQPEPRDMIALSPWIDLKAAGMVGATKRRLEFDAAGDLPFLNFVFIKVVSQYYPDTCKVNGHVGVSGINPNQFLFYFDPNPDCKTMNIDLSRDIPAYAEQVRVGLGVVNFCTAFGYECSGMSNYSPIYDNVRLRVSGSAVTGLPGDDTPAGPGLRAFPNPFAGSVRLQLAGNVTQVRVFDLAGRLVREFPLAAGQQTAVWDGRGADGAAAPPGVYFLRASGAGAAAATARVVKLP